ncbi:MAG: hypothetical protein WBE74_11115 [Terracidiphilus sp.]
MVTTTTLPRSAKVATGSQGLVAVLLFAVWILWASWGILSWRHVMLSGIVFFLPFVLCTIALFGLSKGMMFGWVAGLVGNGASAAVLLFFAGPLSILPAALLVYLLVPRVRDYYVRDYYQ